MFPIAGLTAGPIGQNFFVDTQGWPGVKKKFEIFFFNLFFLKFFFRNFFLLGQRRALQPVSNITESFNEKKHVYNL